MQENRGKFWQINKETIFHRVRVERGHRLRGMANWDAEAIKTTVIIGFSHHSGPIIL